MRRSTAITTVILLALAALMIWTSLQVGQVECRVCMTYQGRRECAAASAPTADDALRSATTMACATITSGRAQSLECGRTPPAESTCSDS